MGSYKSYNFVEGDNEVKVSHKLESSLPNPEAVRLFTSRE